MNRAAVAADKAQDSTAFRVAARIGYVVLGLLHLLIGAVAVAIATGAGGGDADQGGALQQVRAAPHEEDDRRRDPDDDHADRAADDRRHPRHDDTDRVREPGHCGIPPLVESERR